MKLEYVRYRCRPQVSVQIQVNQIHLFTSWGSALYVQDSTYECPWTYTLVELYFELINSGL